MAPDISINRRVFICRSQYKAFLQACRNLRRLRQAEDSPERICALFLCALALFDKDRDAGTAAMNLLRGPRPMTPYDAQ